MERQAGDSEVLELDGRLPPALGAGVSAAAFLGFYAILNHLPAVWLVPYLAVVPLGVRMLKRLREVIIVGEDGISVKRLGRTRFCGWGSIGHFKVHDGTAFMLIEHPTKGAAELVPVALPSARRYSPDELVAILDKRQRGVLEGRSTRAVIGSGEDGSRRTRR